MEEYVSGLGDRLTEGDSALVVEEYVQQWIREKVLLS